VDHIPDWNTCSAPGCSGAVVADGRCLAHVDEAARDAVLATGERLDGRGVRFSRELIDRVLWSMGTHDGQRSRIETRMDLQGAVFEGPAFFGGTTFAANVDLSDSRFESDASFGGAVFEKDVDLRRAVFADKPSFALAVVRGTASFFETRFVFGADFFGAVLHRTPWFRGSRFEGGTSFDTAVFEEGADFMQAVFVAEATFVGSELRRAASFEEATFEQGARFDGAMLQEVTFYDAKAGGDVTFDRATVSATIVLGLAEARGRLSFRDATIEDAVKLEGSLSGLDCSRATFRGGIRASVIGIPKWTYFDHARFEGPLELESTSFGGASFEGARFEQRATFDSVEFDGDARFRGATFAGNAQLNLRSKGEIELGARFEGALERSILQAQKVTLDGALFTDPVLLAIRAGTVSCYRTQFGAGATLGVDDCDELSIANTGFGSASTVAGNAALVSLANTDVDRLVLARLDLTTCKFARSINLDGIRIGPDCTFARTPRSRRWTDRQVIADERIWRGWMGGEALDPRRIAPLYRALRKAREDAKDQPGAADFYYGEMEMRRHAADSWPERLLLTLYWLVSGYGLRAWRAFAVLVITVLACAALLCVWGFERGTSFGRALLFSVQSTTSLLRGPEADLTVFGDWLWIALRLLGPILFGLALLSLRGRVRR